MRPLRRLLHVAARPAAPRPPGVSPALSPEPQTWLIGWGCISEAAVKSDKRSLQTRPLVSGKPVTCLRPLDSRLGAILTLRLPAGPRSHPPGQGRRGGRRWPAGLRAVLGRGVCWAGFAAGLCGQGTGTARPGLTPGRARMVQTCQPRRAPATTGRPALGRPDEPPRVSGGRGRSPPRKSVLRVLLKPVVGSSGSPLARRCRAASRGVGLLARALRRDPKVFEGSGQRVARERRGGHVMDHDDTPPARGGHLDQAAAALRSPAPPNPHPGTPPQYPARGSRPFSWGVGCATQVNKCFWGEGSRLPPRVLGQSWGRTRGHMPALQGGPGSGPPHPADGAAWLRAGVLLKILSYLFRRKIIHFL